MGIKTGSEVWVSFENDDGTIKNGFFSLVDLKDSYVILRTINGSELLIPISKILKIKGKELK